MTASNLPVAHQPHAAIAPGETSSSAIAARERAAVEARFLTAMHRPRDFETSRRRLLDACKRPGFAEAARYGKPVGRDKVYGLSIRFAEEARVLWGNMDVTSMLVFDDDERRIYRVQGTDLETNATDSIDVMVEKFVERRSVKEGAEVVGQRTNSTGQIVYKVRATEDDLVVKVNANISKARRNVILTLMPADVKEECEDQCISTLKNQDTVDPTAARKKILDAFWKYGVTPNQIAELLAHPVEQMTPAEMTLLRSYGTALKEGESTWPEILEAHTGGRKSNDDSPASTKGTEGLKAAVKKKEAAPAAPAADPASSPAAPSSTEQPYSGPGVCPVCGIGNGKHKVTCPNFED